MTKKPAAKLKALDLLLARENNVSLIRLLSIKQSTRRLRRIAKDPRTISLCNFSISFGIGMIKPNS
ncbi:MAG: hypothetical protein ABSF82_01635 [Candidatus Bathyarchaeia archaeon]